MTDETTEEQSDAAPKSSGPSMVIVAIGGANLLATAGLAGYLVFAQGGAASASETAVADGGAEANPGSQPSAVPERGPIFRLEDFVVQLRNPEVDRYARMSFELELLDEDAEVRVKKIVPQVRDVIIDYLADRTFEEMRGSAGLRKIKTDLLKRVQTVVQDGDVRALYITQYVVQ